MNMKLMLLKVMIEKILFKKREQPTHTQHKRIVVFDSLTKHKPSKKTISTKYNFNFNFIAPAARLTTAPHNINICLYSLIKGEVENYIEVNFWLLSDRRLHVSNPVNETPCDPWVQNWFMDKSLLRTAALWIINVLKVLGVKVLCTCDSCSINASLNKHLTIVADPGAACFNHFLHSSLPPTPVQERKNKSTFCHKDFQLT